MAERTNPFVSKTVGDQDVKSRGKAEAAAKRNEGLVEQHVEGLEWPRNPQGKPMVKISITASELIPTGQYANISVGPAQATCFIDPDEPEGLPEEARSNIANAMNQLAEIVEVDVIGVQRALILASMQEQIKADEKAAAA